MLTPQEETIGKEWLQQGALLDVEWVLGVYSVEVRDPSNGQLTSPLLHVSEQGELLDAFCECSQADHPSIHQRRCLHIATAYLAILGETAVPLHIRLRKSLWEALGEILAGRHGLGRSALRKVGHEYQATSHTEQPLFRIQPLTPQGKEKLSGLLSNSTETLHEGSWKLAYLPPQELQLWKEGRPSPELSHELSLWSALAKWWMVLQEKGEAYRIRFRYASGSRREADPLPRWIDVQFPDVEFSCFLAQVNWGNLIPALATVHSPLKVVSMTADRLEGLSYRGGKLYLQLPTKSQREEWSESPVLCIGPWGFIPKKGFFSLITDPLLTHKVLEGGEIAALLDRYPAAVRRLLGVEVQTRPQPLRYHLSWKEGSTLEIVAYLTTPEEGRHPEAAFLEDWFYLPQVGFTKVTGKRFPEPLWRVRREEMSSFVTYHRAWLGQISGFVPRISGLERQLCYQVEQDGSLHFAIKGLQEADSDEVVDFGAWVYLRGKGFYAMTGPKGRLAFLPGTRIPAQQVGAFLHTYAEELEALPGFFAAESPLLRAGLRIVRDKKNRIRITPEYELRPPWKCEQVRFYGDFTYLPSEGFALLPPSCRLPPAYTSETVLAPSQEWSFLSYELDALRDRIIYLDPKLQVPRRRAFCVEQLHRCGVSGSSWQVELSFTSEQGTISCRAIWDALRTQRGYWPSDAGLIPLQDEQWSWLRDIPATAWDSLNPNTLTISTLDLLYLTSTEEVVATSATQSMFDSIRQLRAPDLPSLEGFGVTLRPYQQRGLEWLWSLYSYGLGGILADEMGLGKTVQAAALLLVVYRTAPAERRRFLVVCPTSVLSHWEMVVERCIPGVPLTLYHGTGRDWEEWEQRGGILLTSYGILRSDLDRFRAISFEVAVLDEVHAGKNVRAQVHKALRSIQAEIVLGMTGTPLENHLTELKAICEIVLPVFAPLRRAFQDLLGRTAGEGSEIEQRERLARCLRPFLLRRKREEVLSELPEKIEEKAFCTLSPVQLQLYQKAREGYRAWSDALEQPHSAISYTHIFALITQLKQICDHPVLVMDAKEAPRFAHYASGKWDLFCELLQEALASGRKIVVFCQYLKMLDIMGLYLTHQKVGWAEIRGGTRDRKTPLERFRTDPECRVFLASLQAAGVGIDLTAASVVIHYGRWWNPAREDQATARVYRMGQTRGVQVFTLVTRGTLEEQIDALIERKRKLLGELLSYDDQDVVKTLTRDEIAFLLRK